MPVYIAGIPGYEFYGFPGWGEPGIKVAVHSGGDETTADGIDRTVSRAEELEIVEVARKVLKGITGEVLRSATCLYTVTPDHDFIVDRAPGVDNVVIGAGFSGHGFQQCFAVGRYIAEIVLGKAHALDLSIFSPQRILDIKPVFESKRKLI